MSPVFKIILVVLVLAAAVMAWSRWKVVEQALELQEAPSTTHTSLKGVEIVVTSPLTNAVIASPLTVTGEAPGFWFFEASFPVVVVNWDGLIIGEGYAQAQGDPDTAVGAGWMTQEMVPFVGTVEFYEPLAEEGRQAVVGWLILQRDNPSGLPENDDAIEFSIRFSR